MQSQHQMAIQNYCHCICRANIKWLYKIIVIANAEPTSNGYTKLLSLQMQSQHQMAIQNYCHCKCRAKEKKKSNGTVENNYIKNTRQKLHKKFIYNDKFMIC